MFGFERFREFFNDKLVEFGLRERSSGSGYFWKDGRRPKTAVNGGRMADASEPDKRPERAFEILDRYTDRAFLARAIEEKQHGLPAYVRPQSEIEGGYLEHQRGVKANLTRSFLAGCFGDEIRKGREYSRLKQASDGKDVASPEKLALRDFLLEQTSKEGYVGPSPGRPSIFAKHGFMSNNGLVKLMVTPDEARRLVQAMETGSVPPRQRSEKAQWLRDQNEGVWPHGQRQRIGGLGRVHALGNVSMEHSEQAPRGCYVLVPRESVKDLPKSVKPRMIDGRMDLTADGQAKVFVSRETAREAFRQESFGLSATGRLLFSNPSVIDCASHGVIDGNPKNVLRDIARREGKLASPIYLDPKAVLDAVDRQVNPGAFGSVVLQATRESVEHSGGKEMAVERARERSRQAQLAGLARQRPTRGVEAGV